MDEVAKELKTRTRVLSVYNKSQDEFDTKDGWDDYLETIEDLVYCLVNNVDVQQAEARIKDYERANMANILSNQAKKAEAERLAKLGPAAAAAAAAAASAAAASSGPEGFVPSSLAGSALPRAPMPVAAPALDAHGAVARRAQRLAMGSAAEQSQSAAAGWTPELAHLRAMQEAFGSLLLKW